MLLHVPQHHYCFYCRLQPLPPALLSRRRPPLTAIHHSRTKMTSVQGRITGILNTHTHPFPFSHSGTSIITDDQLKFRDNNNNKKRLQLVQVPQKKRRRRKKIQISRTVYHVGARACGGKAPTCVFVPWVFFTPYHSRPAQRGGLGIPLDTNGPLQSALISGGLG